MKIFAREDLYGEFAVSPDRSITHRAIAFGSVASGRTIVVNPLLNEETLTIVACMKKLGAKIKVRSDGIEVKKPKKIKSEQKFDCGDCATVMRYLCGIAAGSGTRAILTGSKSLCQTPMRQVKEPLEKMGATVALTKYSVPPILVEGATVRPIEYKMPIGFSPVQSAILLCALTGGVKAKITEEVPSRNHSEIMLKEMGANVHREKGGTTLVLEKSSIAGKKIYVPGDFTCALYYLALGIMLGKVTCRNVGINPTRTKALDVLERMGAKIVVENKRKVSGEQVGDITAYKSDLKATHVLTEEAASMVDELPIIAVLMGVAEGESVICDAGELESKDFDKLSELSEMINAIGGNSRAFENGIFVSGVKKYSGGSFSAQGNALVEMAAAVALTASERGGEIEDHDAITELYPDFLKNLDENAFAVFGKKLPKTKNLTHAFVLSETGVKNFSVSSVNYIANDIKKNFTELKNYDGYTVTEEAASEALKRVLKLRGNAGTAKTIDLVKGITGYSVAGDAFGYAAKMRKLNFSDQKVLVIGCGSFGKSIIVKLLEGHARVDVYDPSIGAALDFRKRLKESVYVLREISGETPYDVIINADRNSSYVLPENLLTKDTIVIDASSIGAEFLDAAGKTGVKKSYDGSTIEFFSVYHADCVLSGKEPTEDEAFLLYMRYKEEMGRKTVD